MSNEYMQTIIDILKNSKTIFLVKDNEGRYHFELA